MKVYLVAEGSYSDYGVVGLFSTEEKAEEYCQFHPGDGWGEPYIDGEFELDDLDKYTVQRRQGKNNYMVMMDRDGNVKRCAKTQEKESGWLVREHLHYIGPGKWEKLGLYLESVAWARDEEHATKIVNERRAAIVAANRWEDGERSASPTPDTPPE